MSNRERRRELIFGILFTLFGSMMLFGGMAAEHSQMMIIGFVFLLLGGTSWIKLAVHKPSKSGKDRPIKQNAAHVAREAELAELKRQQELAHEARKQSYKSSPEPLQIRQWNAAYQWDWKIKRHGLDRPLYFWSVGQNSVDIFNSSGSYKDLCVILPKDGVWCLCPLAHDVTIHMNSAAAREKCPGMTVNTQQFTVRKGQEQELLPGDCFVLTRGTTVAYFRIDHWSIF